MTTTTRRALALLLVVASSGCGYALVGKGITTDASIKKIAVPLFKDATAKPGLDRKITDKVMEELLKRGRFEVVPDPMGADAVVEGELLRHDLNALGVSGAGDARTQASRYAVTVVARVKYTKTGAAEPIWQNERFAFTDEYEVNTDPGSFFDQEGPALDRLATSFARSLVAAMLEAF